MALTPVRTSVLTGVITSVHVPVKRGTHSKKAGGTGGHVEHWPGCSGNPSLNHIHVTLSTTVNAVTVIGAASHGLHAPGPDSLFTEARSVITGMSVTVVLTSSAGLKKPGKPILPGTTRTSSLATGSSSRGRHPPSLDTHAVVRNLYDTFPHSITCDLTVATSRVPSGSEIVRVNLDIAENFEKNAFAVAPVGMTTVGARHTILMVTTGGSAFYIESALVGVFPGSVHVVTPGNIAGYTALVTSAALRPALSIVR